MIFLFNANGNVLSVIPEKVNQNSNKANTVHFLCPTSQQNSVCIAFTLADGKTLPQTPMTANPELTGLNDIDGNALSAWKYELPFSVTAVAGNVTVQFYILDGQTVTATGATQFTVQKGVDNPNPNPETTQEVINAYMALYASIDDKIGVAVDNKVDKVSGQTPYNKLYAKDWAGNQTAIDLTEQVVGFSAVQRDGSGVSYVSTPSNYEDKYANAIVNMSHLQNRIAAAKIYKHSPRACGNIGDNKFDFICSVHSKNPSEYATIYRMLIDESFGNVVSASGWYKQGGVVYTVFGVGIDMMASSGMFKLYCNNDGETVTHRVANSLVSTFTDDVKGISLA